MTARRHRGMGLVPPFWWARWYLVALPLAAAVLGAVLSKVLPPTFTATARLLPPQTHLNAAPMLAKQAGGQAPLALSAMGAKVPSDLYAQLFFSRSVQDPVIEGLQLLTHWQLDAMEDARTKLEHATAVTVARGGIIELAVRDGDAARSAAMANAMIDAMYAMGRRITREAALRQQAFYDQLIAETRERLHAADNRLLALERSSGLTRMRGQEEATSAAAAELKGLLTTREVDLAKMLRSATLQHPDVQRMRAEIGALRGRLAQLERPRRDPDAPVSVLMAPDEYPQQRHLVEPARREVEALSIVLQDLLKAREATRIDEARDFSTVVVLDRALPPKRRSAPVTLRLAASAFATAFLAALGFAFWQAQRRAVHPPLAT